MDLTAGAYRDIALRLHRLAHELCGGRLLALAGGGYVPEAVARCWAIVLGTLAGPFADGRDARLARLLDQGEVLADVRPSGARQRQRDLDRGA